MKACMTWKWDFRVVRVLASSLPMRRLYPAASAQRTAASFRFRCSADTGIYQGILLSEKKARAGIEPPRLRVGVRSPRGKTGRRCKNNLLFRRKPVNRVPDPRKRGMRPSEGYCKNKWPTVHAKEKGGDREPRPSLRSSFLFSFPQSTPYSFAQDSPEAVGCNAPVP